jgi:Rrf2 family protein
MKKGESVVGIHRWPREAVPVQVSARTDYAVRALAFLAARSGNGFVKGEEISTAERIPLKFLLNILAELRHAGVVTSHRGSDGGYALARSPEKVTLADVISALAGETLTGAGPEANEQDGAAVLRQVWLAVQANIAAVLESVTLSDLARGTLAPSVTALGAGSIPKV